MYSNEKTLVKLKLVKFLYTIGVYDMKKFYEVYQAIWMRRDGT